MHHGTPWYLDVEFMWQLHCWTCGILWPLVTVMRTKKPTSLDDAWALLPKLREQVCLQPDGTYVRLKTSWEAVDPAKVPEGQPQPQKAPTILVGGKALEG